ncbi:hypothetical protein AB1Y20_000865 [Prymnesium parvum]|uniref:Uncharacterized protein n=1 Tax=Prymnesium parvum TaxID=97485 RepID=A0AB34K9T9_PRYPA
MWTTRLFLTNPFVFTIHFSPQQEELRECSTLGSSPCERIEALQLASSSLDLSPRGHLNDVNLFSGSQLPLHKLGEGARSKQRLRLSQKDAKIVKCQSTGFRHSAMRKVFHFWLQWEKKLNQMLRTQSLQQGNCTLHSTTLLQKKRAARICEPYKTRCERILRTTATPLRYACR